MLQMSWILPPVGSKPEPHDLNFGATTTQPPIHFLCRKWAVIAELTVNVLKLWTLSAIPFWPNSAFYAVVTLNTQWNGKQYRPWSDCSFRSSLIWDYTVCIWYFISNFCVQNFRTFTVYMYLQKKHIMGTLWKCPNVVFLMSTHNMFHSKQFCHRRQLE